MAGARHDEADLRRLLERRLAAHAPVAARPAALADPGARRRRRAAVLPEEHAVVRAEMDQDGHDPGAERRARRRLHRVQRRRHARVAREPGGARVPPGAGPPRQPRPARPVRGRHRPARRRVRRRGRGRAPGARDPRRPGARDAAQDHRRQGPARRGADRPARERRTPPARRDPARRDRDRTPAGPGDRRVPKGQARGTRDARPVAERPGRHARGPVLPSDPTRRHGLVPGAAQGPAEGQARRLHARDGPEAPEGRRPASAGGKPPTPRTNACPPRSSRSERGRLVGWTTRSSSPRPSRR